MKLRYESNKLLSECEVPTIPLYFRFNFKTAEIPLGFNSDVSALHLVLEVHPMEPVNDYSYHYSSILIPHKEVVTKFMINMTKANVWDYISIVHRLTQYIFV